MAKQQVLLDRLIAEHYTEEILTVDVVLPEKECTIVKVILGTPKEAVHFVPDGVIVQVAIEVKLLLVKGDNCYLSQEGVAGGSFHYPMFTTGEGRFEFSISLRDSETIQEGQKVTVVIPSSISLWYVQTGIFTVDTEGGREPILADLVITSGSERQLLHQPLSIAVASGLIRTEIEARTLNTSVGSGEAVVSGVISGGLYYAAPNGTERYLPINQDFSFLITDVAIEPTMEVKGVYHVNSVVRDRVLKVILSMDWLIFEKRAIFLAEGDSIWGPFRVDCIINRKQAVVQFKDRFSLGEEIRKIRTYQLYWGESTAVYENGFVLASSEVNVQVAGVTPVEEVKEFDFSTSVQKVFAFPDTPGSSDFQVVPETQYLRVELLPHNYLGVLGQVRLSVVATHRQTLELPERSPYPSLGISGEREEVTYSTRFDLPSGFLEVDEISARPVANRAVIAGEIDHSQGELILEALVHNKAGETRLLNWSLPFWHFGSGEIMSAQVQSHRLEKETGWKGMLNRWYLQVEIKAVYSIENTPPEKDR